MKFIYAVSLLVILSGPVLSQNKFEWQLPVPTGHDYTDMQMLGNNVVVAVGLEGTFIRSEDGGMTWSYHYARTQSDLKAVYFVNNDTGFVAGINFCNFPNLMKTMDGGITWDTLSIPNNFNLNDVYFLNADTGWVAGYSGAVYCTHNGGLTWINQSVVTTNNFNVITMLDRDTGFVAGNNGHMRKTTDGGYTWDSLATGTTKNIYSLYFTSYSTGFLAAFGELIKRTTNGGQTWNQQYNYAGSLEMTSIFFSDSLHGFGVSPYRFYRSTNGGVTWNFTSDNTDRNAVAAINSSGKGVMVGAAGNIKNTTNNGTTWTSIAGHYNFFDFKSITFTDKTHGWAVGTGRKLLRTSNGVTWTQLSASPTGGDNYDVCFLNNNLGYIVGDYGIVYKTTNGGTTLTNVNIPTTASLACVFFINDMIGWVGGDNSALYKTTNGGASWTLQSLPNFVYFLKDIFFVNQDTGYAGGSNNLMFKTVNGGNTWITILTLPSVGDVDHIQFLNADTGWISSGNGHMVKTTDGGLTWQYDTPLGISPAYGFHFYDAMNGFVGGGTVNCDARFYHTHDGGVTWQNTHLPLSFDINAVYMTDTNSVYICGDNGNIIHSGDSINTVVTRTMEINEPLSFNLFPNPASGQFTVTSKGVITYLSIADITGRILFSTSCNSAEIIVTTNFLNDGIYLVTIKTQKEFTQTKKLVVRKNND